MTRHRDVRVQDTKLGRAVFARRSFARGEKIGRVEGRIIRESEDGSRYCMDFGDGGLLEPRPPFRYLNHRCDPNCELVRWEYEDSSEMEMHLYASQFIRSGEELTIDYAWSADWAIPCGCESRVCRGWIVAIEDLPLLQQSS